MKYFKDENKGEVYAYDQEQIDGGWVKEGLVLMTDEEVNEHLNPTPPTYEELVASVEAARKSAYADAQTGSDRLFAEAQRMQMMGESGWEEVRDTAIARYSEIKAEYPWPEDQQ